MTRAGRRIGSVCVYAGSSRRGRPGVRRRSGGRAGVGVLARTAASSSSTAASRVGLMGIVAEPRSCAGGRVVGVIPDVAAGQGDRPPGPHRAPGRRVDARAQAGDDGPRPTRFVALPGGSGTLEELFETFTWLQLGLHRKPIGLLDVNGYWARLVRVPRPRGRSAPAAPRARRHAARRPTSRPSCSTASRRGNRQRREVDRPDTA